MGVKPRRPGPAERCGAKTRSGRACRYPAGHGTYTPGQGRCRLHGGLTPIKSGRYSQIDRERIGEMVAEFEGDPDPLDLLPELALARALLLDYVERYDEMSEALLAWHESFLEDGEVLTRPPKILDISSATKLVSEVTKIAKRIEDIAAANAISRSDMVRIMTEMGRVVERYVPDERSREKIRDSWLEIRL